MLYNEEDKEACYHRSEGEGATCGLKKEEELKDAIAADPSEDFDYINFDPDEYFYSVVLSDDCEDYVTPLEKVPATEENYNRIREALLHAVDVIEYFELLVDKFGEEKVQADHELLSHVYEVFDREIIDDILS